MAKDGFAKFFTIVVPLGLFIATIAGIAIHVVNKDDGSQDRKKRAFRQLTDKEVSGFVERMSLFMPERGLGSEKAREGLRRMASTIHGTLSPENAGYAIQFGENITTEGELFRPLWVDLTGENESRIVRVYCNYDGDVNDIASISSMLSVAQSISNQKLQRTVRFVFLTGAEANPLGVSTKTNESYGKTIWVDVQRPDELSKKVHFHQTSPSEPTRSALMLSDAIFAAALE